MSDKKSKLENLIEQSSRMKKEMVPATVRMTKELHSFVDGLAEELVLSKQEILLALIEEGADFASKKLGLDKFDGSTLTENEKRKDTAYFLLNTNKRHELTDQDDMLENKIAAAYYGSWKENIKRIKSGDYVFLYENAVGIVAYGKGSGKTLMKDKNEDKDQCYYQELSDFVILDEPIPANKIKQILGRNVVFLRTMTEMPTGKKLLDKLTSND